MNLHLIIGEDDYLVDQAAKKIIGDGTGLELIDSRISGNADTQMTDLRRADASFSTPPFLDPRKVTWWRNVHFLPGGGRSPAEEVKTALERFAKKLIASPLPENQHFILSGPHLLKTSVFAKTLTAVAETLVFTAASPWDAQRQALQRAEEFAAARKLVFAPAAIDRFVATVGTDTRSLLSEINKMCTYLGDAKSVTVADVDAVTSQGAGVEPAVWAVTDALGARDLAAALAAAEKFAGSGYAVLMTSVIEKFFRQLLDVSAGQTEGLTPYAQKKLSRLLPRWTTRELRLARGRFMLLREKAVSGASACDEMVDLEMARACRRAAS